MGSDLISRSDAIKRAKAAEIEMGSINGIKAVPMDAVIQFLEIVPAVDAEKVVRCKECIFRNNISRCKAITGFVDHIQVPDDFFCASGERRGDDE